MSDASNERPVAPRYREGCATHAATRFDEATAALDPATTPAEHTDDLRAVKLAPSGYAAGAVFVR